jgi:hypothetical protein
MASLTITTNLGSRSKNAGDAKANALLGDYAAAIGASGTIGQRMDAVLDGLVRHMQERAQQYRRNQQTVAALAAIQAEVDALTWE